MSFKEKENFIVRETKENKIKKIAVLGSTGSVGQMTLQVVRSMPDIFSVIALACDTNIDSLEKQMEEFSPSIVAVFDEKKAKQLHKKTNQIIIPKMEGLISAACSEADIIVAAMTGSLGLLPISQAIKKGKTIAIANKELLVAGGEYIISLAKKYSSCLLPVDSEHSAIFQCLQGEKIETIKRLILTASGGPFLSFSPSQMKKIQVKDALKHPTYLMGKKNTIDSSTLMNKGLEVIEASILFDVSIGKISVTIHPQSIVHSMVEFIDGSILSQMSEPDMIGAIQYALCFPKRKKREIPFFNFSIHRKLEFYPPEKERFPCLFLAIEAGKMGKSMPCFMNKANEVLVNRFLQKEIGWIEIGRKLEKLMSSHREENMVDLDAILEVEKEAYKKAVEI